MERLIKLDKPEFLGRDAYIALKDKAAREKLVVLDIDVTHNADATGGEPVFLTDGTPVGRVTSGSYGFGVEKSLALAFIKNEALQQNEDFHVALLGINHAAKLLQAAPFDPKGERLRS